MSTTACVVQDDQHLHVHTFKSFQIQSRRQYDCSDNTKAHPYFHDHESQKNKNKSAGTKADALKNIFAGTGWEEAASMPNY